MLDSSHQCHLYATDVRQRRNAFAAQGNLGIQDKVTGDKHLRMQASFLAHDGCSKDFKWDNRVTEPQLSHGSVLPQYGFFSMQTSNLYLAYSKMCAICTFWLDPIEFEKPNIFLRINL